MTQEEKNNEASESANESETTNTQDQGTGDTENGDELAKLKEEISKLKDQLARVNADYQNLAFRHERERSEMANFFTENFAKKLLPTLDNLERVVSGTPEELRNWVVYDGVKQAANGLQKVLEHMGITSYASLWEELDPRLHEALSQGPGPSGKIIAEFEKGYKHKETVIRHAKVVVGNGEEIFDN